MSFVTVDARVLSDIYTGLNAATKALAVLQVHNDIQLPLDLGEAQALEAAMEERAQHAQAIDAFMDERRELQATVSYLEAAYQTAVHTNRVLLQQTESMRQGAAIISEENAMLRDENDALANTLTRSSLWVLKVRETLAGLGITFETDELDEPKMSIDLPTLSNSIERVLGLV